MLPMSCRVRSVFHVASLVSVNKRSVVYVLVSPDFVACDAGTRTINSRGDLTDGCNSFGCGRCTDCGVNIDCGDCMTWRRRNTCDDRIHTAGCRYIDGGPCTACDHSVASDDCAAPDQRVTNDNFVTCANSPREYEVVLFSINVFPPQAKNCVV